MNCYRITSNGQSLGQVWAITPGSAIISWRLALGFIQPLSAMRAERVQTIEDEVMELACDRESLEYARNFYGLAPRRAFRVSHHYAREQVSQRHDFYSTQFAPHDYPDGTDVQEMIDNRDAPAGGYPSPTPEWKL